MKLFVAGILLLIVALNSGMVLAQGWVGARDALIADMVIGGIALMIVGIIAMGAPDRPMQ